MLNIHCNHEGDFGLDLDFVFVVLTSFSCSAECPGGEWIAFGQRISDRFPRKSVPLRLRVA